MIEEVKKKVYEILGNDNSGHGNDHISRVLRMSLKFSEKENANKEVVSLIALLHDVDDYKLVGQENSKAQTNTKRILDEVGVSKEIKEHVLSELQSIGYSNLLKGKRPKTIEGQIVSDADMCDTLGANGILRIFTYSKKNGKEFFNKNIFPIEDIDADKYTRKCADTSVCHIFEKALRLKKFMFTSSGKEEATYREKITIDFLYHLFDEEDAKDWKEYLDNFLKEEEKCQH